MNVRILLFALLCGLAGPAQAQSNYPSRPVRIVVPSPPAGGTDIIARVLAQYFSTATGQQFFVENRPGAGNMIGIESVARAAPDGYTLLFVPSTLALNSVMYKKISYDPVRDFAPITLAAAAPNVLVINPKVPAQSVAELIALAKQKPGQLTYGTPGIGTSPHMAMELFKSLADVDLRHIPYRGTAPAMTDVISGQITAMFSNALTAKPQIESGAVRALGVSSRYAQSVHAERAADRAGGGSELRGNPVVRAGGAGGNARRHRRPSARRGDTGAQDPGHEGQARQRRRRAGRHHARGVRRAYQERASEMGKRRARREDRAAIGEAFSLHRAGEAIPR